MKYCPLCRENLKTSLIDGQSRLNCPAESCHYVFWENPTPVVAAIVELDGKIILVQSKSWGTKMFGLVSGFLEKGETPDKAILREVKEELGLDGKIRSFIGYYSFFKMNQLILVFHIEAWGEIVVGQELAAIKYIPPEKLRPWSAGTGPAVKDWLENRNS